MENDENLTSQSDKIDEILPEYQDFFTRVADRVNSGAILADLPQWIIKHTKLKGKPWSFKDHEFQKAIARDQAPRKAIKKCSQVGLTELQVRLALAYLRVSNGRSLGYIMPYRNDAENIAKSRFDPVIEESPTLSSAVLAGSNSASYKKIGNSHLYIRGAEKVTQGISTPLDRLIIDERDFCRDRVLGVYSSRMRHADDPMRDEFSTPTISNYGICAAYEQSDKKRYMVRCLHCNQYQAPNFYEQVVIPGYDGQFLELEREDFMLQRYKFSASYMRCVRCGKELDTSLATAERREWVAEKFGRTISGYAVKPYDLYRYNSTPRVVEQFVDYPVLQDYCNFVLGEELDTNENKINDTIVQQCFTGKFAFEGNDLCVGIDVGKNVHVMTGRKEGKRYKVAAVYKLRFQDPNMFGQVCEIIDAYNASCIVIDAGPDISLPKQLQEKYGVGVVFPCVYVKGTKQQLNFYEVKEETGVVNAARTMGFDHMVKAVNSSYYEFPDCEPDLKKEIREHFQQIARKQEINEEGEKIAKWVKLSDMDHYFHALFYLHLAITMTFDGTMATSDVPSMFGAIGASIGGQTQHSGRIQVANQSDLVNALSMYRM